MKFRPVLTAEQARELDQKTIDSYHFSEDSLMESAGLLIASKLESVSENSFLFFAGFGNNGGDALVALRHLALSNKNCKLFLFELNPESKNSNYKLNRSRLDRLIIHGRITVLNEIPEDFNGCIIDGLFGSGLSRDLNETTCSLISWINNQKAYCVSIDLPSGLDSTSGFLKPVAVKADLTLTIGFKKVGFFYNDGVHQSGKIEILSIGFDHKLIKPTYFELDEMDDSRPLGNKGILPQRSHKYDEGFVSIIAGSEGLSGAAYLASKAALAAGAAAVQLFYPAGLYPVYDILLPDVLKKPIGKKSDRFFKPEHIEQLFEKLNTTPKQTIVLGPGLSNSSETKEFVVSFLTKNKFPLILDADALSVISVLKDDFSFPIICTPHIGELKIMTGQIINSDFDRVEVARSFAMKKSIYIFSKGTMGCFIQPDGTVYFLPFTNEKLKKTGYGDVFSGWLGRNLLILKTPQDAFFNSALELFEKAKHYSPDDLCPEHLISISTK